MKTTFPVAVGVVAMIVAPGPRAASAARISLGAPPAWATAAALQGRVAPAERMDVRLHLRLRDHDAALAEAAALTDPDDPRYGRFLTTQQFRERYAPTVDDAALVRAWLEAHGLIFDYAADNRLILAAHGAVAQVEAAFETRIARYRKDGRMMRAPMTAPSIPAELSRLVVTVGGLHDGVAMRPAFVRSGPIEPRASSAGITSPAAGEPPIYTAPPPPGLRYPPGCAPYWGAATIADVPPFGPGDALLAAPCAYAPPALRRAYGVPARGRHDGSGITIALVEAFAPAATLLADVQRYAAKNDPAHPFRAEQLEIMMAPGADPATPPAEEEIQAWYREETLDVEAIHAFAPGAKILLVFTKTAPDTNPAVEALNHIVDNDLVTIVSNSYGDPELYPGQDYAAFEAVAIQANLKGVGLYFASGDFGNYSPPLPQSTFPASLPQVTAVGGTSLAVGRKGRRLFETAWASTIGFWIPGTASQDGKWVPAYPGLPISGGGGGTSTFYPQPDYQTGVVPDAIARRGDALMRVVPDVSLVGNPDTGLLVGITQTFPDGAYYDEVPIGGTSLGTPLLAGLVALAEQRRGARIGFINPTLYKRRRELASDVVPQATRSCAMRLFVNGVDATGGLIPRAVTLDTEVQSIHTAKGFDDTTGLGVVRVRPFVHRLGRR